MPTSRPFVSMAFAGIRDGAALFGIVVGLLGGASVSLFVAFWGLMVFTFVLFVAPQNTIPALRALAPARTAVAIALIAYLVNRAQTG